MSHETVARYVDSIFTRYQTELRRHLATLVDPEVEDVGRACRHLDCMIETLTAFAIGHAVGRVVEAMRRLDGTLAEPMSRAVAVVRAPARPSVLPPPRFFADGKHPIIDTLGGLLHQRLALAARHARELVGALAAVVPAGAFERTLGLLSNDPAAAFAFVDQLALGWRFYVALVTNSVEPVLPDEPRWQRGRALWSAWSRRIRSTAKVAATRFTPIGTSSPDAFILRIA